MGNEQSITNNQGQIVLKNFNQHLGQVRIIRNISNQQANQSEQSLAINNSEQFQSQHINLVKTIYPIDVYNKNQIIHKLRTRMMFPPKYALKIKSVEQIPNRQLCNTTCNVQIHLQSYAFTFGQFLNKQIAQMKTIPEQKALVLLLICSEAIISLYDSGCKIHMLDPETIVFMKKKCVQSIIEDYLKNIRTTQAQIKIIDTDIGNCLDIKKMVSQKQNKQNTLKFNLAPQRLIQFKQNQNNSDFALTPKSDIFSLGMLFLQLLSLKKANELCSQFEEGFNYQLANVINEIPYSLFLKQLIADMLQYQVENRIGFVSLQQKIWIQLKKTMPQIFQSRSNLFNYQNKLFNTNSNYNSKAHLDPQTKSRASIRSSKSSTNLLHEPIKLNSSRSSAKCLKKSSSTISLHQNYNQQNLKETQQKISKDKQNSIVKQISLTINKEKQFKTIQSLSQMNKQKCKQTLKHRKQNKFQNLNKSINKNIKQNEKKSMNTQLIQKNRKNSMEQTQQKSNIAEKTKSRQFKNENKSQKRNKESIKLQKKIIIQKDITSNSKAWLKNKLNKKNQIKNVKSQTKIVDVFQTKRQTLKPSETSQKYNYEIIKKQKTTAQIQNRKAQNQNINAQNYNRKAQNQNINAQNYNRKAQNQNRKAQNLNKKAQNQNNKKVVPSIEIVITDFKKNKKEQGLNLTEKEGYQSLNNYMKNTQQNKQTKNNLIVDLKQQKKGKKINDKQIKQFQHIPTSDYSDFSRESQTYNFCKRKKIAQIDLSQINSTNKKLQSFKGNNQNDPNLLNIFKPSQKVQQIQQSKAKKIKKFQNLQIKICESNEGDSQILQTTKNQINLNYVSPEFQNFDFQFNPYITAQYTNKQSCINQTIQQNKPPLISQKSMSKPFQQIQLQESQQISRKQAFSFGQKINKYKQISNQNYYAYDPNLNRNILQYKFQQSNSQFQKYRNLGVKSNQFILQKQKQDQQQKQKPLVNFQKEKQIKINIKQIKQEQRELKFYQSDSILNESQILNSSRQMQMQLELNSYKINSSFCLQNENNSQLNHIACISILNTSQLYSGFQQQKEKYFKEQMSYEQNANKLTFNNIQLQHNLFYQGSLNQKGHLQGTGILYQILSIQQNQQQDFSQLSKFNDSRRKFITQNKLRCNIYSGTFKDNQYHGFGTLYYNQPKFNNTQTDTKQNTEQQFDLTRKQPIKYDGQFQMGKQHRFGTYVYSNGQKFSGNIRYGQIDGYGCFYGKDQIKSGVWKYGVLVQQNI